MLNKINDKIKNYKIPQKLNYKKAALLKDGDNETNTKLMSLFILTAVEFSVVLIIIIFSGINNVIPEIVLLLALFFLIIFGSNNYSIWKTIMDDEYMRKKDRELQNLAKYSDSLEHLYNEMRSFKHDYVNILSSMKGYIDENDMEGLKKYFDENISELYANISNSKIGMLQNLKMKEVKGLIGSKLIYAQNKHIQVNIEVTDEIDKIRMNRVDLIRVMGILLDNAIEAAQEAERKKINLAIIKNNNSITIIIANTFKDIGVPIHKMFKSGFSTKGEGRGLGLNNVREIINQNNRVSIDTFIENGYFNQVIDIEQI